MHRIALTSLVLLCGSSIAQAATKTIDDNDFLNTSWSTTVAIGGVGDAGTAGQNGSIGNSAPSREVSITVREPGPASVGVFSVFQDDVLNSAVVGDISDLSFAVEATHLQSTESNFAHRIYPVIEQDGLLFIGAIFQEVFVGDINRLFSFNSLTESDFLPFDRLNETLVVVNIGQPDFSASGSAIKVGFMNFRSDRTIFGNDETHRVAYDNFSVIATVAVPEPASLVLLALGGLSVLRRR